MHTSLHSNSCNLNIEAICKCLSSLRIETFGNIYICWINQKFISLFIRITETHPLHTNDSYKKKENIHYVATSRTINMFLENLVSLSYCTDVRLQTFSGTFPSVITFWTGNRNHQFRLQADTSPATVHVYMQIVVLSSEGDICHSKAHNTRQSRVRRVTGILKAPFISPRY